MSSFRSTTYFPPSFMRSFFIAALRIDVYLDNSRAAEEKEMVDRRSKSSTLIESKQVGSCTFFFGSQSKSESEFVFIFHFVFVRS